MAVRSSLKIEGVRSPRTDQEEDEDVRPGRARRDADDAR
jgi:hypothetical protein